jgi:arylsulfatase A-like enzyme
MIDTLRADHLGIHGNPRGSSPAIDSIAAEGVTFERAIAQAPWTQPSIASLFCSLYPGAHQVLDYRQAFNATFKDAPKVAVFGDQFDTLAESLQGRGYATAGFVANPYILAEYGFAQGFDHFDTTFANNTTPGGVVNQAALTWLTQRDAAKPFFLYLHYMDPHGPYDAGAEYIDPLLDALEKMPTKQELTDTQFEKLGYLKNKKNRFPPGVTDRRRHARLLRYREYWAARYEAGVRQVDHFIAELRTGLQQMGLWDEAYVIVTADHGEALCEHDFWEHGWSAHHTDLHVPLILRWPGQLPTGKRVRHTVRLIDLMPTLLDQLRLPMGSGIQGRSLAPYIAGRPPSAPTVAFAEGVKIGAEQKAVYLGDWKLIITFPRGGRPPLRKLYRIGADPLERQELSAQHRAQANALASLLQDQINENNKLAAGVDVEHLPLSPEQIERLRSLGYLQ